MNLVIIGPSGSGKGTLTSLLLLEGEFVKSVSYTTRIKREKEINGRDYYFVERECFEKLFKDNFFFEVTEYGGNYYGIPKKNLSLMNNEKDVIFDLVPTSGINIKKESKDTCLVYVMPPTLEELNRRRGNRSDERLKEDVVQMLQAQNYYDFIIKNDDLKEAYEQLKMIISVYQHNSLAKNENFMDNFFEPQHKKIFKK